MNKKRYDHTYIENKWQEAWEESKEFEAKIDRSKQKFYILDMFPYPSGAGLHVGHVTGYTATDIVARYKRQMGFNVLHPMGWDSFGLPAEQYAIRTGTHPAITTAKNVATYKRQLKSLGFSYDWSKELMTSDPKYYKWTQWIFTKLYEKGLAYEAEVSVNFCPALGTVLANEEVENGKSKEGGYPVERRPLRQWILKITEYAERLLEDLDELDWPEYLKKLQRNWIGKSEGLQLTFPLADSKKSISCFTTRSDTIFGVSYLVLAPEHPLVNQITTDDKQKSVQVYKEKTRKKSDLERTELNKDKTGVFTGAYAVNPITDKKVPIWISDYVLPSYGTGAVMGVASHCQRDFEFVKKFNLEVLPVINPESDEKTKKCVLEGELCWEGSGICVNSQNSKINLNGLSIDKAKQALAKFVEEQGIGKVRINYKLRDWLFSRQRYWGEPFPILHFEDGTRRILDVNELPLTPPELTDFHPSSDGNSPLAKKKDWVEIIDPKTKKKAIRETNTMPQWAGSCWYYLRFCDPNNDKMAWSKENENYWMPVDLYVGGVEHAVLHLLYARFWHKVLYDLGHVSTSEPFQSLRNQGLVTAKAYKKPGGGYLSEEEAEEHRKDGSKLIEMIEKMSKSKLNGVSPDEIIEEYGADSLRLYEMFMAPFDKEKLWNTDAVNGCYRFLCRFYDLVISEKVCEEKGSQAMKLAHKLIKGVQEDIEQMFFNTAIAKMMEFINDFSPLDKYPKEALKMATQALYPFAPHMASECWQLLGEKGSITYAPFPKYEESLLVEESATYVVQVNGKVRSKFILAKNVSKDEVFEKAKSDPKVAKYLSESILKVIFVPNKLLNIVVKN